MVIFFVILQFISNFNNNHCMNKLLLSFGLAAVAMTAAQASTVTLNVKDCYDVNGDFKEAEYKEDGSLSKNARWENVTGLKIGDYTFGTVGMEGGAAPAIYQAAEGKDWTLRVYIGAELTIVAPAGEPMAEIVLNCASIKGVNADNMPTASVGTMAIDGKVITWSNSTEVDEVTITFPTTKDASNANPNVQIYEFVISTEAGSQGGDEPEPTGAIYENSLLDESCGFVPENIFMDEALSYVWSIDSKYGLKATSFLAGTAYACEAYMVSPVLDLTGSVAPILMTFEQASNFFNDYLVDCGVYAREEGSTEWIAVNGLEPRDNNWTYTPASLSLDDFAGKKIQVGFKYSCDGVKAGTWEMKNLVISGGVSAAEIVEAEDAAAVYYDLSGRRVMGEPQSGLYIKISGNKAQKVLVK